MCQVAVVIEQDPSLSCIQAHKWDREEQSRERISTQELCTHGPGDMPWEHKSALHWALVINKADHQEGLELSGRLRLQLLVEDRHVPLVQLTQHRGKSLKDLPTVGKVPRAGGWIGLSLQEK